MIHRAFTRLALILAVAGTHVPAALGDDAPQQINLLPYIGDHYLLVDDYLRSSRFAWTYDTGAVTGADIFGAFADFDGDGIDDLIWLVDHEVACDGDQCDLFVFAPVDADLETEVPIDWIFVERLRVPIKRAMFERFAFVDDRIYRLLLRKPDVDGWTEATGGRLAFVDEVYGGSAVGGRVELSDVRIGTHDVNHDGRDEIFIYVVSPDTCYLGECGGDILELLPGGDGNTPAWRSIGRLGKLAPNTSLRFDSAFFSPARVLRATGKQINGYDTLCSTYFMMRWKGTAYDLDTAGSCVD